MPSNGTRSNGRHRTWRGRDQRPDAQPAAGLFDPGLLPDRHLLARAVGMSLLAATDRFLAEGFEPFRQEWTARDMLLSRPITIHDGERTETSRSAIEHC